MSCDGTCAFPPEDRSPSDMLLGGSGLCHTALLSLPRTRSEVSRPLESELPSEREGGRLGRTRKERHTDREEEIDSYLTYSGTSSDYSFRSFSGKNVSFLNRVLFLILFREPDMSSLVRSTEFARLIRKAHFWKRPRAAGTGSKVYRTHLGS